MKRKLPTFNSATRKATTVLALSAGMLTAGWAPVRAEDSAKPPKEGKEEKRRRLGRSRAAPAPEASRCASNHRPGDNRRIPSLSRPSLRRTETKKKGPTQ